MEIVVYVGKHRVIHEKRESPLSQKEIRGVCNEYHARIVDIKYFPNRLDYLEYIFSPIRKSNHQNV